MAIASHLRLASRKRARTVPGVCRPGRCTSGAIGTRRMLDRPRIGNRSRRRRHGRCWARWHRSRSGWHWRCNRHYCGWAPVERALCAQARHLRKHLSRAPPYDADPPPVRPFPTWQRSCVVARLLAPGDAMGCRTDPPDLQVKVLVLAQGRVKVPAELDLTRDGIAVRRR